MRDARVFSLPAQHLMPDALVAFVDGELPPLASQRVSEHLARCPMCRAEVAHLRQAATTVRMAHAPAAPGGLLASLCAIPQVVELPQQPDGLAITADGQFVVAQRPDKAFPKSPPLGTTHQLGQSDVVLGAPQRQASRRAAQGASMMVSGLVIGALTLVAPNLTSGLSGVRNDAPAQVRVPVATPVASVAEVAQKKPIKKAQ